MVYEIKRTSEEIDDLMNRAVETADSGSKYPGMSFEQGVIEAIDWITGQQDEEPMPPGD